MKIIVSVTLLGGTLSGMLISTIWNKPSTLVYLGAVPGVIAGFVTCYFLFRIKRRLRR